jgi:hypothetical protein
MMGKTSALKSDLDKIYNFGRPKDYPVIDDDDHLLFYIQRNQNYNTVIYEVNLQYGNLLNLSQPISIHWLNIDENGFQEKRELNYIQKKMAFGYTFNIITNELIEFRFVSYDNMKFYLAKNEQGRYRVYSEINNHLIEINSLFIYAEDFGVFPQVKFVEFYGKKSATGDIFYKKLNLE